MTDKSWEGALKDLETLEKAYHERLDMIHEQLQESRACSFWEMMNQLKDKKRSAIENSLINYCKEIDVLINEGKTLREISIWSYNQRQSGRNVPYLAVYHKGEDFVYVASPIKSQEDLKEFFGEESFGY